MPIFFCGSITNRAWAAGRHGSRGRYAHLHQVYNLPRRFIHQPTQSVETRLIASLQPLAIIRQLSNINYQPPCHHPKQGRPRRGGLQAKATPRYPSPHPIRRDAINRVSTTVSQNVTEPFLYLPTNQKAGLKSAMPKGALRNRPYRAAVKPKPRCETSHIATQFGLFRNAIRPIP